MVHGRKMMAKLMSTGRTRQVLSMPRPATLTAARHSAKRNPLDVAKNKLAPLGWANERLIMLSDVN